MLGAFWAIGSAIVFSLSHIAIRKGVGVLGVAPGTAIMLVVATGAVGVAALLVDEVSVLTSATLAGVLYFAAAGLVHFVGGWMFMNASTRLVGAARMSATTSVTPLIAALLAIVTLHESLNLSLGLGILLIMAGTYFVVTS